MMHPGDVPGARLCSAACVVFHEPVQPGGGVKPGVAKAGAAVARLAPTASSPVTAVNRTFFLIYRLLSAHQGIWMGDSNTIACERWRLYGRHPTPLPVSGNAASRSRCGDMVMLGMDGVPGGHSWFLPPGMDGIAGDVPLISDATPELLVAGTGGLD
jgi:hypothetical protein